MSINQTGTVDIISTSPEGRVTLTISDHYSWEENWHLQLLQDKIKAYLQYIESRQIFEDYPKAVGQEIVIEVAMKFEPNLEAITFLEKVKEISRDAGTGFQWRALKLDE